MHYLMFIDRMKRRYEESAPVRFLVSGADHMIRHAVLRDIAADCYRKGHSLFVVDDLECTVPDDYRILKSPGYRLVDGLDGSFCLYDPFQISTLKGISRFRQLLEIFGYDEKQKAKILSYFRFLLYLENLENPSEKPVITIASLAHYNSVMAVEQKIQGLLDSGVISPSQQISLLAKYAECSSAAADFEDILLQLLPFIQGNKTLTETSAGDFVLFRTGELGQDETTRKLILLLLQAGILEADRINFTVVILDRGYGNREGICRFIEGLPQNINIHIISDDIFNICESSRIALLLNRFTARIYSRHCAMSSCREIESICGDIDVIHRTYTETRDRRWRANSPLDILFGNNKTEIYGSTAPVREPRYRKEVIANFDAGTGIIDFMGQTSLFSIRI